MSHQNRREPLPENYQFGDARGPEDPKVTLVKTLLNNACKAMLVLGGIFEDGWDVCATGGKMTDNPFGDRSETRESEAWRKGFLGCNRSMILGLQRGSDAKA